MPAPPVLSGAFQETEDDALAFEVAFTAVGALASVAGVAEFEAALAALLPETLVAVTVKV